MLSIRWAEESGRVLRSARYPCSIQARTVPPGCQARLPQSSSHSVARSFFCVPGWASLSGGFRQPSDPSLSPCGSGRFCGLTDTTFFSLRPMSSGRVLGMHAPLPLAVRQNPRTLIFYVRIPLSRSSLSLSPGCCRLFSSAFLESRRQAFTSRFPGPHGPSDHLWPGHQPPAQVCMLPLPI
jgi:hypothetical protein